MSSKVHAGFSKLSIIMRLQSGRNFISSLKKNPYGKVRHPTTAHSETQASPPARPGLFQLASLVAPGKVGHLDFSESQEGYRMVDGGGHVAVSDVGV